MNNTNIASELLGWNGPESIGLHVEHRTGRSEGQKELARERVREARAAARAKREKRAAATRAELEAARGEAELEAMAITPKEAKTQGMRPLSSWFDSYEAGALRQFVTGRIRTPGERLAVVRMMQQKRASYQVWTSAPEPVRLRADKGGRLPRLDDPQDVLPVHHASWRSGVAVS